MQCAECGRKPRELSEYVEMARFNNESPSQFVRREEGTYNPISGQFWCTECYIRIGQPMGGAP